MFCSWSNDSKQGAMHLHSGHDKGQAATLLQARATSSLSRPPLTSLIHAMQHAGQADHLMQHFGGPRIAC